MVSQMLAVIIGGPKFGFPVPTKKLGTAKYIAVSGAGEGLAEIRRLLEFESTQKNPAGPRLSERPCIKGIIWVMV